MLMFTRYGFFSEKREKRLVALNTQSEFPLENEEIKQDKQDGNPGTPKK